MFTIHNAHTPNKFHDEPTGKRKEKKKKATKQKQCTIKSDTIRHAHLQRITICKRGINYTLGRVHSTILHVHTIHRLWSKKICRCIGRITEILPNEKYIQNGLNKHHVIKWIIFIKIKFVFLIRIMAVALNASYDLGLNSYKK